MKKRYTLPLLITTITSAIILIVSAFLFNAFIPGLTVIYGFYLLYKACIVTSRDDTRIQMLIDISNRGLLWFVNHLHEMGVADEEKAFLKDYSITLGAFAIGEKRLNSERVYYSFNIPFTQQGSIQELRFTRVNDCEVATIWGFNSTKLQAGLGTIVITVMGFWELDTHKVFFTAGNYVDDEGKIENILTLIYEKFGSIRLSKCNAKQKSFIIGALKDAIVNTNTLLDYDGPHCDFYLPNKIITFTHFDKEGNQLDHTCIYFVLLGGLRNNFVAVQKIAQTLPRSIWRIFTKVILSSICDSICGFFISNKNNTKDKTNH